MADRKWSELSETAPADADKVALSRGNTNFSWTFAGLKTFLAQVFAPLSHVSEPNPHSNSASLDDITNHKQGSDEHPIASVTGLQAELDAKALSARTVTGNNSISGGGDLTANRVFELVNDVAAPGPNQTYGTDGAGVRGWKNDPAGGGSVVNPPSTKGDIWTHDGATNVSLSAGTDGYRLTARSDSPQGVAWEPDVAGGVQKGTPFGVGEIVAVQSATGAGEIQSAGYSAADVALVTGTNAFASVQQAIGGFAALSALGTQEGISASESGGYIVAASSAAGGTLADKVLTLRGQTVSLDTPGGLATSGVTGGPQGSGTGNFAALYVDGVLVNPTGGGIGSGTPFVQGELLAVQSTAGEGSAQTVGFPASEVAQTRQIESRGTPVSNIVAMSETDYQALTTPLPEGTIVGTWT